MPRLQECPAITALNGALNVFPNLRRDTLVDKTPATRHTSGLAIDIFFNSYIPHEKQRALDLIDVFVKHQKVMKWSDLIFTDFHIGGGFGGYMGDGKTKFPWTGGSHDDHIHLDWVDFTLRTGPEGSAEFIRNPYEHSDISKQTGWLGPFEADLRGLASSWSSVTSVIPQWVTGWWTVYDGNYYYYYFSNDAFVTYTTAKPSNASSPPPRTPMNEGKVTMTGQGLVIDWNPADGGATKETFTRVGASDREMNGVSNRYAPLFAKKMI